MIPGRRYLSNSEYSVMVDATSKIAEAAELLRSGELVAFPTETVYGLGADASSLSAIAKLYRAKGRPSNHPVIVHLADFNQLPFWANNVPDSAKKLAEKFWPGPLTMILPKAGHVLDDITGGQSTVGLRIPAHPVALELLRAFGGGLIAPSANKFGRLSPTRAEDVRNEFQDEVAMVLDGGPCAVGIESTIIDLSIDVPMILRPGMISHSQIESAIGPIQSREDIAAVKALTRVPGDLASHYAPVTPLKLVEANQLRELVEANQNGSAIAVLSFNAPYAGHCWIVASKDPDVYARDLYHNLRQLDKAKAAQIIVEQPPVDAEWNGIRDRLQRAAK